MKAFIFAGGAGTRLWPLSRKNSPKQFEKVFNGTSTLQMAVDRISKTFTLEDIYISTNEKYVSIVKAQLPKIPSVNIIAEPEKRDLAAAIGYNVMRLKKTGYQGPVVILWSDHLMENVPEFIWALKTGGRLVKENPKRVVFVGEKPRYAENNLGWIHLGAKIKNKLFRFEGWKYRPHREECKKMFASKEWVWNPGYFIFDIDLVLNLYKKHMPDMYKKLLAIEKAIGTVNETKTLRRIYPTLESIHFDNAILEKVETNQAIVVTPDMGWSDPGTLYALKEALQKLKEETVVKGEVFNLESKDCLVFNYEKNKLVATVGLEGMIVVNMDDALIVVKKEDVLKVKELVPALEKAGLEKYV